MSFFYVFLLGKLFCLTFYFFIASQAGFYLLAFGRVLRILGTDTFFEIRRATDVVIERPLKVLYPAAFFGLLVWVTSTDGSGNSTGNWFLVLSLALLLADLVLAISVSIPLNKVVSNLDNSFTADAFIVKQKWIRSILIRAYVSVAGFVFLILHVVSDVPVG